MGPFIYVLGTQPRHNVLGTCSRYTGSYYEHCEMARYSFRLKRASQWVKTIHCATCEVILMCNSPCWSGLAAKHLEHCSRYTSVHTCFGCVLQNRFDHVPAGTVLAGTILFTDYKKWCVPRAPRTSMNARYIYFPMAHTQDYNRAPRPQENGHLF